MEKPSLKFFYKVPVISKLVVRKTFINLLNKKIMIISSNKILLFGSVSQDSINGE